MKPRTSWVVVLLGACLAGAGCSSVSAPVKRAGIVALGAAGGGAGGYLASDKSPGATLLGAVAGAALTHVALGNDESVRQDGFDHGYVQGQSDAIKRQYFLRLALEEKPPAADATAGETVYYLLPGPEVTVDGRKLAPHQVAVPVVE